MRSSRRSLSADAAAVLAGRAAGAGGPQRRHGQVELDEGGVEQRLWSASGQGGRAAELAGDGPPTRRPGAEGLVGVGDGFSRK